MSPATDALAAARRRVLERLAAHEIDASAAAAALRSLEMDVSAVTPPPILGHGRPVGAVNDLVGA